MLFLSFLFILIIIIRAKITQVEFKSSLQHGFNHCKFINANRAVLKTYIRTFNDVYVPDIQRSSIVQLSHYIVDYKILLVAYTFKIYIFWWNYVNCWQWSMSYTFVVCIETNYDWQYELLFKNDRVQFCEPVQLSI